MKKTLLIFIFIFSFSFTFAQKENLKPNKFLDTQILKGPDFNLESNYAEFEFKGINFKNPNDNFYFQVKLLPFDLKWENVYSSKKVYYSLPKGSYWAILMVRAVNYKKEYDPTPAYYLFKVNVSKFYKDIYISPSYDGLKLTLSNNSNKEIKITNWQIKTSIISFKIPKAIRDYHPNPLLRKEEDIILKPYEKLVIIATSSPLGINFLGNRCFSYLNKIFNLNYSVSFCDRMSNEEILNLALSEKITRKCASMLSNISCGPISSYDYKNLQNDLECLKLALNFYNYNSCYDRNRNNKDFFEKEWRVYFDPKPFNKIFQTRFEKIRLEDENGLLVNEYKFY